MTLMPSGSTSHAFWDPAAPVTPRPGDGKIKPAYVNVHAPVTELHMQQHIDGIRAVVACPVLDDGNAKFGCADADVYGIDITMLTNRIAKHGEGWPLYACRSNSAGHVFFFLSEALPAENVQAIARGVAKKLRLAELVKIASGKGLPGRAPQLKAKIEPFPDGGRQLNMPYLGGGGKECWRVAPGEPAREMPLEEFLDTVQFLTQDQVDALIKLGKTVKDPKASSPVSRGRDTGDGERERQYAERALAEYADSLSVLGQGERDAPLLHAGIRLGRMIKSGWLDRERIHEVLDPALAAWDENAKGDLDRHLTNGEKKGEHSPLADDGSDDDMPRIVGLRKTISPGEDPLWHVTIEGSSDEMRITDVRDIADYKRFTNQCISQLDRAFDPVKNAQNKWQAAIKVAMRSIVREYAPEDTTPKGRFKEYLETYLTNRQAGRMRDDMLSGRPWHDEENGRYEFTMAHLQKFLGKEKAIFTPHQVGEWVREMGGDRQNTTIKKHKLNLWWVPSDAVQKLPEVSTPEYPKLVV